MATTSLETGQMPEMSQHPPYAPQTASLGGVPTIEVDVPITAVFLFLFMLCAATHMIIFQLNRRKRHKFIMSGLMFGFCMSRIVTCIMRIVWATRPTNVRIAIAAQVFVAAGVVLLFVINVIFAQRIIRSAHPNFGWHKGFALAFKLIYVLIVLTLIMLITCTVQSFYTLNTNTRRIDRDVQIYGQVFYAAIAFLPIPLVIGGLIVPRKTRVEKFGSGRFRSKIRILLFAAVVLCLGASFRAGTNIKTPRPRSHPAWYQHKACFYIFNFTVELLVIVSYAGLRVDRRFHVPNGSHAAGDYSGRIKQEGMEKDDSSGMHRVFSEEETFDDAPEASLEAKMEAGTDEETCLQRLK